MKSYKEIKEKLSILEKDREKISEKAYSIPYPSIWLDELIKIESKIDILKWVLNEIKV